MEDMQAAMQGSSPLTRGKRAGPSIAGAQLRLIPAHAGKTSERTEYLKRGRAHPRSRGENELGTLLGAQLKGSSPLTRGKPHLARLMRGRMGLIPAHAGKTF